MMLRALLPSVPQRYAFVGSAIGALLPLVGYSTEYLLSGRDPKTFGRMDEPVHALMLAVPLLTGIMAYCCGRAVQALNFKLRVRARAERHLINLSQHDRLIGLANRRGLEREVDRLLATPISDGHRPALLLLDLDRFKHVNDTLGHDAGDELLRLFAERLQEGLGPLARLFRLGGDEFVVTLAGVPDEAAIDRLCRRIEERAEEPFALMAGTAATGISIGVTTFAATDRSMSEILKRADLALYIAKDVPGSSHAFHSESLEDLLRAQAMLEREIVEALADGHLFLEYQPIVRADSHEIVAFEALVRWRHQQRGVVFPGCFLPLATRTGHMGALGRWVARQAIAEAARWPETVGICINAGCGELCDPGFAAHIGQCLGEAGIPASRLTVEVTEAVLAKDDSAVHSGLWALRELGVRIALDNFGTGHSSINLLRRFPIDQLKVDRSFTRMMLDDRREGEFIDLMVRLGRIFDVPATVEGVENEQQLNMALSLGAAAVQGYHISEPVSAATIQDLLATRSDRERPELRASA